jgi:hypothetical protein
MSLTVPLAEAALARIAAADQPLRLKGPGSGHGH